MELIVDNYQKYLQNELENEHEFSHSELYELFRGMSICKRSPGWKRRYDSLRQDTNFFKNIVVLHKIRARCDDENMLHIELDMMRIPQEVADFEVVYTWMRPTRWYSYDWRVLEHGVDYPIPSYTSMKEMKSWDMLRDRFKKIIREHLPICSVNDFINFKVS